MKTKRKSSDKIRVITLGCSKNTVDSERLIRQLTAHSLQVIYDDEDPSEARTVIINTCGFIKDAKQESIDTILQYAKAKKKGNIDRLYIIGCLSERYKADLEKELPEVDEFFGVNDLSSIVKTLGYNYRADLLGEREVTTPAHYAYLKVSEGCNRQCAFCAIPVIRGPYVSKTIEDLTAEADFLAKKGVKELLLIAQDLSSYGYDLYKKSALSDLLKSIISIKNIEWIKLHYAYPSNFPLEILDLMNNTDKICHYLDIPFQHISDRLLKAMRRGHDATQTRKLIDTFRTQVPDIALRSSFIVGFPGESDADFQQLCNFAQEIKFERLGIFTYSHEEQTWAGEHLKDDVPDKIKKERYEELMRIQQAVSLATNQEKIGEVFRVLVDRREGDVYIGRTQYDSPEVDNEVVINSTMELQTGAFYNVKITDATEYDLFANI